MFNKINRWKICNCVGLAPPVAVDTNACVNDTVCLGGTQKRRNTRSHDHVSINTEAACEALQRLRDPCALDKVQTTNKESLRCCCSAQ